MKKNTFPVLLLCLLLSLTSVQCGKKKTELTPEIAASDELLYRLGEKYIKKDPDKARLYMRQVIDSFPRSFYAQRAKLAVANSYYNRGDEANLILAAAEYREFISLYPFSPSASFAQFRIGMTFFSKALKAGRDQTKTMQAMAEFQRVMTNYPLSEEAKEAQEKILECEERLAEHTLQIGRHYHRIYAYKAATERLREILTNYPSFSKMDEVYFYLGDSYLKWNKRDESIPFFTKLISDFPKSKFAEKAADKLKEIDSTKKTEGGDRPPSR